MRVAVLCDIHANLPALHAVLAEVEEAQVDLIVFGGDVAAGPLPVETIELLAGYGGPARFVRGNADRVMVEIFDTGRESGDEPDAWPASSLADPSERQSSDVSAIVDQWSCEKYTQPSYHSTPRGTACNIAPLSSTQPH